MANRISRDPLYLEERMNYLEDNGFYHYGAVITGPTKELLQLQEEELISTIMVDEIAFWNWSR